MSTSEQLLKESTDAAAFDPKRRGELAELAFMRKAASLGFCVAKPWGESDRYDVIVSYQRLFWRIQVKSVCLSTCRRDYRIRTTGGGTPYTAEQIDFLIGYVFPRDAWYIFPAALFQGRGSIYVVPDSKRSRFEQYREAWDLMKSTATEKPAPSLEEVQAIGR